MFTSETIYQYIFSSSAANTIFLNNNILVPPYIAVSVSFFYTKKNIRRCQALCCMQFFLTYGKGLFLFFLEVFIQLKKILHIVIMPFARRIKSILL